MLNFMPENTVNLNIQSKEAGSIDLLRDDYTIIRWLDNKLHAKEFPYVVAKIVFGIYAIIPIPEDIRRDPQQVLTWLNGFLQQHTLCGAALVLDQHVATYFRSDGRIVCPSTTPPDGGSIVNWKKYLDGTIKLLDGGNGRGFVYASKDDKFEIVFSDGMSIETVREGIEKIRYEIARKSYHYGFIPHRLAIPARPELSVFSLNVLFGGPKLHEGKFYPMVSSLYEPDFETFKDTSSMLSMKYYHVPRNLNHWLVISYNKDQKSYTGEKFVNAELVGMAHGKEWNIFFAHFTNLGVSDREPFENNEDVLRGKVLG